MPTRLLSALLLTSTLYSTATIGQEVKPIGPDELDFSISNMDPSVSPAEDFYRYTSGAWQDRAVLPPQLPEVDVFSFMREHVRDQMVSVIEAASAGAGAAAAGSPEQQIGDLYNSYMNVEAIDAAGMAPLQPELDRLAAVDTLDALATYLGSYSRMTNSFVLGAVVPNADRADATKMVLWFLGGTLSLNLDAIYEQPDDSPLTLAYLNYVSEVLQIAGDSSDAATDTAKRILELERILHAGKATRVEKNDPRNVYNVVSFAELQAEIPELDLTLLARGVGLEPEDTIVKTEPRYLAVLSQVLRDYSLDEIKEYLRFRLILSFSNYLSTDFEKPLLALYQALVGVSNLPPRAEQAQSLLSDNLGHPLSRLYVDAYFSEDTRQTAYEMMDRIKAAFLERIKTRSWLSEETRAAAIDKLEHLTYFAGYPDEWVDYSGVEISSSDIVANISRLNQAYFDREIAKMGKPVVREHFNDSGATLPIIVNAAYSPSMNGFDVPAAILQPGMFDPAQPAPVYFCRLGAVLGHEMTHGFDSGGRLFNAEGNLSDWWTPDDAAAFEAEAQKLVDQANAFEVLPGVNANGALNVKENMADYGGITLAYDALMAYLADHPEENVEVDGFTPTQLCFIAWGQMWVTKATDQYTTTLVSTDVHAPGSYRAFAPLQHIDAFYDAFGIKEGDKMWLPPEQRVHAW